MITFNGIRVIQVPDGDELAGGCAQCCFHAQGVGCVIGTVYVDEWTVSAERDQFGGDCVENKAHYELDEK